MEEQREPQNTRKELSARELVSVLVRFLAVMTLVGVITGLANFAASLTQFWRNARVNGEPLSDLFFPLGALLVTLVIVAWLWLFPEAISDRIVPEEYDGYVRFDLSFREIQALVFSLFGLYLLTLAIPLFVRTVATAIIEYQTFTGNSNIIQYSIESYAPYWIQTIAQIVLAIVLFVWSRRLVRAMYYDFSPETEEAEDESPS